MSETKRLTNTSEIFVLNATSMVVDVFVNYETTPTVSDPTPLLDGSTHGDELTPTVLVVDGEPSRPFGVYTFEVRPKGEPGSPLLAAASIRMEKGHSFSGAFHPLATGGHQFSIYENDLSRERDARLTVRHTARLQSVDWKLEPSGSIPDVEPDLREGTLAPAEWQLATGVTDNEYVLEFRADGDLVARVGDLRLAAGKNIIVYLIGHTTTGNPDLGRPIVYQELEYDRGAASADLTTPSAPPASTTDANAPVRFGCDPVTVWQTETGTSELSAVDPDGVVTNLTIDGVEPPADGVQIEDGSLLSAAIGDPAAATVRIGPDLPSGSYQVTIAANRGSLAQQAGCDLAVTVRPITIERLQEQVSHYRDTGDIEQAVADELTALLDRAQQHQGAGDPTAVCSDLTAFLDRLGTEKGKAVSDTAHDDIAAEADALRSDIGC